jgi:hypothetical protein
MEDVYSCAFCRGENTGMMGTSEVAMAQLFLSFGQLPQSFLHVLACTRRRWRISITQDAARRQAGIPQVISLLLSRIPESSLSLTGFAKHKSIPLEKASR